MSRVLFTVVIAGIILSSCNKEVQPLSQQEIKRKTDSLVTARKLESDQEAKIDLERRMKIEVKVKVDSILNARAQKAVVSDVKQPLRYGTKNLSQRR